MALISAAVSLAGTVYGKVGQLGSGVLVGVAVWVFVGSGDGLAVRVIDGVAVGVRVAVGVAVAVESLVPVICIVGVAVQSPSASRRSTGE
jgi:hypothetical protein